MPLASQDGAQPIEPPVAAEGSTDSAPAEEQLAPDEEYASPEEEAAMEKAIDSLYEYFHDVNRDKVVKMLRGEVEQLAELELFERVSQVAYPIIMKMKDASGQELDLFFWENLATVAVEELFEIAAAAGVEGAEDEKAMEAAFLDIVVTYGEQHQNDPQAKEAAQQAAQQLAESGMVEQGMEAMSAMEGQPAPPQQAAQQPAMNPLSAGVQQGLGGPPL